MLAQAEEIEEEVTHRLLFPCLLLAGQRLQRLQLRIPWMFHAPCAVRACWHWFRRTPRKPNAGRASPG